MDSNSEAIAKVTRPTLPDVLPRKRLFDQLTEFRQRPIIWVSGPPGCGKTTLIGSYIESFEIPSLWYNLDEGDSDPATFFYYLGLAAQRSMASVEKPLPLLTPEYLPGISTFTRHYFERLCLRLDRPAIMVFDNYEALGDGIDFHEIMRIALSAISKDINVILISRNEPPAAFARNKANRTMRSIGWDQLRFTLNETEEFLRIGYHEMAQEKSIAELYRTTNGWVAGLVLLGESGMENIFDADEIIPQTQQDIFNYFANEVFDKTDENTRKFLVETSFLPEITEKLSEDITGQAAAGLILSELCRSHYFTEKRFQQREPIYRYHPLFKEYLMSKAADILSPNALVRLRHRTAVLLERSGQMEAAVSLYHDNEDWQEMSQLLIKHGPLLLGQGRNIFFAKWLTSIPSRIFESDPWLLYWAGACYLPMNPSQSQSYFEGAYIQFKERQDENGLFLAWSGMIDAIALENEDLKRLDRWILELEDRIEAFNRLPPDEITARVTNSMFFALFLRKPRQPGLEHWAQKAIRATEKVLDVNIQAQYLFNLAHYRMMNGDMDQVASILHRLNRLMEMPDVSALNQIGTKFVATCYCQATGFYAESLDAMEAGLKISEETGVHVWEPWLLGYGASGAMNHGDDQTSEQLLTKMSSYLDRMKSWELSGYHYFKARQAMIREDLEKANAHAALCLDLVRTVGVIIKWCWPLLLNAQIKHRLRNYPEANQDLTEVFAIAQDNQSKLFLFHAHMVEAQFAFDGGIPDDGFKALGHALDIGKEQKYQNIFVDSPTVTANLCVKALEADLEVEYVQNIIRRRCLIPSEPPIHLENWPWALKIYTLGRFSLVKDGKPMRFTGKAQEKPLTLLKALIAFGGREVREEQIADALWPEADGDQSHKSFATTLWRLRKLIGYPEAVVLSEGKLQLNPRYCWVDVWALERILGQADSAWNNRTEQSDLAEAVTLVELAIDSYQGPFLAAESDCIWAKSKREGLQGRMLQTLKRLGNFWKETGRYENAVECYQRSLEIDELDEDVYHALMACYGQADCRAAALAVYERCKATLSIKFGLEPSERIEALRDALLSKIEPGK